jgi:hypothetical protein
MKTLCSTTIQSVGVDYENWKTSCSATIQSVGVDYENWKTSCSATIQSVGVAVKNQRKGFLCAFVTLWLKWSCTWLSGMSRMGKPASREWKARKARKVESKSERSYENSVYKGCPKWA